MDNNKYKILIDNKELNEPFFSVIVLTYNASQFIEQALKNIYNQNFDDFELVLVNDGSNDDTDYIVNKNQDKRLRYIKNNSNEGVGNSRELAINLSRGKYIVFVDVDDIVSNDLLSSIKNEIDKHDTDFIIYGFNERYIDKANKLLWSKNRLPYEAYRQFEEKNGNKYNYKITEDNIANSLFIEDTKTINSLLIYLEDATILGYPWNKCYKAQIVKENNIHFENISIYEDIFFNLDYYQKIKSIVLLNKVLYIYNNKYDNKSLTKKDYDNFFELSKNRVNKVYNAIDKSNNLDVDSLEILKRIYIRYAYSELNRCINRKYTVKQVLSRFDEIRNDQLFEAILDKLKYHIEQSNNKKTKVSFSSIMEDCFIKKKKKKVILLARIINFVNKYLYVFYLKLAK